MWKILIITEKPSVAQSIATVLDAKKRGDGSIEGGGSLISWCFGHLVELALADACGTAAPVWGWFTAWISSGKSNRK